MSEKKKFHISYNIEETLTADDIWPDGDGPENPTCQDVIDVMRNWNHNITQVLDEWSLSDDVPLVVTSGKDEAKWDGR